MSHDTTLPEPQRDDAMWYARALELRNALDRCREEARLQPHLLEHVCGLIATVDSGEPPAAWAKMQDALSAARHAAGWFAEHAGDCGEGACKDAHEDLEAKLNALEEAT